MQTSSFLLPRHLLDRVQFDENSPHEDWDFLLRLSKQENVRIETVPEVLVILHSQQQESSLAARTSFGASLEYLDKIQPLLTLRAYSGYCLTVVGERAAREHAYGAFPELLRRAFRYGSPRLWHMLPYFGYWTLPQELLRRLRDRTRHRHRVRQRLPPLPD